MMEKLEKFLMPVANVLSKNKVLSAIRDGFLITVPITIVGSIFLLISNFPMKNSWLVFSVLAGMDILVA